MIRGGSTAGRKKRIKCFFFVFFWVEEHFNNHYNKKPIQQSKKGGRDRQGEGKGEGEGEAALCHPVLEILEKETDLLLVHTHPVRLGELHGALQGSFGLG